MIKIISKKSRRGDGWKPRKPLPARRLRRVTVTKEDLELGSFLLFSDQEYYYKLGRDGILKIPRKVASAEIITDE